MLSNHQKVNTNRTMSRCNIISSADTPNLVGLPRLYYTPSFGYCEPHMRLMKSLNDKFAITIESVFAEYENARNIENNYNAKLATNDNSHKMAAQMLAQYVNYQYTMAEVIPSYALESAPELAEALSKTKIYTNPVDIILTINNIQTLKSKTGIDKNTGKPYTEEQMRKSKANTQLYSAVLLVEMLDKNLAESDSALEVKNRVLRLRNKVLNSICDIYGVDAFERIQKLKTMGSNANIEDKRASLRLMKEFDEKAQELVFGSDFNEELENLVNYINQKENRTAVSKDETSFQVPVVTLKYHTHSQEISSGHNHNHEHGYEHINDLSCGGAYEKKQKDTHLRTKVDI